MPVQGTLVIQVLLGNHVRVSVLYPGSNCEMTISTLENTSTGTQGNSLESTLKSIHASIPGSTRQLHVC